MALRISRFVQFDGRVRFLLGNIWNLTGLKQFPFFIGEVARVCHEDWIKGVRVP